MIWDPSTLAQLSAPGFNRAIGAGDVVPYWGSMPDAGGASGAGAATPGVSFDPAAAGGVTSPVAAGGAGDSALNNLSALTPILNQIMQQQQADSIVSGQGNAQANPLPGATPGISSGDVRAQAQAGGVPIAGSGDVAGIAPAPVGGSTPSGAVGADVGVGGGAAAGPVGGTGVGDTGQGDIGESGGGSAPGSTSSDAGTGAPGAAPGESAGNAAASSTSSDAGAGAGAGDGGSSVICSELRRQGYLNAIIWQADEAFGRAQAQATRDGYRLWAAPIARGMARSRVLTFVVASLAIPWAREMAYQMGVRDRGSLLGRAIMAVGLPLCKFIGGFGGHVKGVRA